MPARAPWALAAANDLVPDAVVRYQQRYLGVQFRMQVGPTAELWFGPDGGRGRCRLINTVMIKSRRVLKIVMEANTVQPQKVFARGSDAICFLYQIGTLRDVRNGDLVAIPLADPDLARGVLVLAALAGRSLSIPAASFVETLRGAFGQLSEVGTGAREPLSEK